MRRRETAGAATLLGFARFVGQNADTVFAAIANALAPDGATLEEAAARSTRVGNEDMPDEVRWIRSYVLGEGDGSVGTVCN